MVSASLRVALAGTALALANAAPVSAQWGNLKGKFVYDGPPPLAARFNVAKQPQRLAHNVVDERLTVDAKGGIKDVVVYVRSKNIEVHPALAKNAAGQVVLDNKNCRFEPHVLPMLVTQTLVVKNSDAFAHNSNVAELGGPGMNPLIQPGEQATYKFGRSQFIPQPVACNVHDWMKAHVLPRDNPYFAVSRADGGFEIKDLPLGNLEFQVWQEKSGYVATKDWQKGRFEREIKPGDNDLGTIKLPPAIFDK